MLNEWQATANRQCCTRCHRAIARVTLCCRQAAQINETISTCRFAQSMMNVSIDARKGVKEKGGLAGLDTLHGNLMKLDPVLQQYLAVSATALIYFLQGGLGNRSLLLPTPLQAVTTRDHR